MSVIVIGVTGPSCSGKTTLAHAVAAALPGTAILEQDLYFRDPDECPIDANFCDLRWLRVDDFVEDFTTLASGAQAKVPTVDFQTFKRKGQRPLGPVKHLVVEGMTILRIPPVYQRCDFKYYVDCDFDTIACRKRSRDSQERAKPAHIIESQLAWMRDEHTRDHDLRSQPGVTLVPSQDVALVITQTRR